MRYQVPQFIDIEDQIFGPLTIKQFLYVAGGVAIGYLLWESLPLIVALIVGIPVVAFFFALAFKKFNDRPLIFAVENAFKYFFSSKRYIWNKKQKTLEDSARVAEAKKQETPLLEVPKLSESKLRELSWSLDINETLGEQ